MADAFPAALPELLLRFFFAHADPVFQMKLVILHPSWLMGGYSGATSIQGQQRL